jgi:hypothetical protein
MKKQNKYFKDVDKLVEWFKEKRPETVYVVRNPKRYDDVLFAIRTLAELAEEANPGNVRFSAPIDSDMIDDSFLIDELTGVDVCFSITTNLIVFEDMDRFREAMAIVDNFEIVTLDDDTFELGFVFNDVYRLADPYNKNK